jgi:hypothetical protein
VLVPIGMSVVGIVAVVVVLVLLAVAFGSWLGGRSRARWDASVGCGESRAQADVDAEFERPSNEGDLL